MYKIYINSIYILVRTREFSNDKVLNMVDVELKHLKLHLLLHSVNHSVTSCGHRCNFNYVLYMYIYTIQHE